MFGGGLEEDYQVFTQLLYTKIVLDSTASIFQVYPFQNLKSK